VADEDLRDSLGRLLAAYEPESSADGAASVLGAVDRCAALRLLLLGETSPDSSALDLLQAVKARRADLAVLVVSTCPTVEHATEAMRRGAEDFISVPFSLDGLRNEVDRILEAAVRRDGVDHVVDHTDRLVPSRDGFEHVISRSARMRPVFDRALAASRSPTPVLIVGETGTGKELIARAIHTGSSRATRPFVPINCAALPHDLLESELFGHRRGAFSGALTDYPGLFVAAHGGTVFLDEIAELPMDAQAKLLRVLQDGEVRPVGALESRHVDVRIIAASNRSVQAMRNGLMRQDLFFRLSVLIIDIPPLRDRPGDLPVLIAYFLAAMRKRGIGRIDAVEPQALELLAKYPFPGNIRELENLLESWAIAEALRRTHGNKRQAAHLLGISRDTLYRKLHELGINPEVPEPRT
jgi:DNA-binding NtrC family response regulator